MSSMYRDDKVASRAGMATGKMEICKTCGKPQNPKKPHQHPQAGKPETVPLGTGIANIGKQSLAEIRRRRREALEKY